MWRPLLLVTGAYVLNCCGWIDAQTSEPEVSEKCSPLVDPSRLIICQLNKQEVDCHKPMTVGTKAVLTCNTYYTQFAQLAKYEMTCMSDGKWSRPLQSCLPRCGVSKPTPTFSFEKVTVRGYHYWWYLPKKAAESDVEFSWHAGIYAEIGGMNALICGGTIISDRVILTAAHCFWDSLSNQQKDQKIFKIAVGKVNNDWYTDGPYVQKREINEIILHRDFRGPLRNYESDIALVKIKVPLLLNIEVQPICMDFDKNYERIFLPGKIGIVLGWGGNQIEVRSKKLRRLTLPLVEFEECERGVPSSFHAFLTVDKFCAGYRNGTNVCPGDGGGGYATKFRDGKWYLMGIVSIGVAPEVNSNCNLFTYTAYTRVSLYYDFIISSM